MIKTYDMLLDEFKHYTAKDDKIARMVKKGVYIKLTKGLYEDDATISGHLLANAIYGPSYLSFEYALSYHGLIPELVYNFTSATFKKKKEKEYTNFFGTYLYKDVPPNVFPFEILLQEENGYYYKIASAEKALCDTLYKIKPIKTKKELQHLLFIDLRIDEEKFNELDKPIILELCDMYPSTNLKILKKVIR